ncbi:hypothetical protein OPV22_027253 [Ensete ventricosum]|uniref:Uncharacterized protein n=1 Tax=Ensete ventricosum TaxID=4639 RepID=A0AAV8P405_ENSVE|nr:hypothetical protein OPV22_027253 [Ensete ventricosum]RWW15154.1 hypothetical protein GW17_00021024 [Ensete ventricosum]RWW72954.1 hypothetical protein BHE74_00019197 [Ensete ventricosum]
MRSALPHRAPHLFSNERQPLPLVPPPTTKQPAAYAATVVGPCSSFPTYASDHRPLCSSVDSEGGGDCTLSCCRRRRQWVILLSAAAQGTIVPYRLGVEVRRATGKDGDPIAGKGTRPRDDERGSRGDAGGTKATSREAIENKIDMGKTKKPRLLKEIVQ